MDVRTTLLAAHALPPEFAGRADDYIDYVCARHDSRRRARRPRRRRRCVLRDDRLHAGADAARVRRGARARAAGQAARRSAVGHGRRALAADTAALSADHLEYTNDAGVAAMAQRGTRSRSCCRARSTRCARRSCRRSRRCARSGVPMAIATDCNPGTSPVTSLPLMHQHGVHVVPPDAGGSAGRRHRARRARARPARSRHARRRACAPTARLGDRRAGGARVPDRRQSAARRRPRRPRRWRGTI